MKIYLPLFKNMGGHLECSVAMKTREGAEKYYAETSNVRGYIHEVEVPDDSTVVFVAYLLKSDNFMFKGAYADRRIAEAHATKAGHVQSLTF